MMKKRSLKIDRLRFDSFLLLMYFFYYSTFMIDIQYFNSLIVIFFTFITLVFTRKSTEAKNGVRTIANSIESIPLLYFS